MANISYYDLLTLVLSEVHGCSNPLAEQEIRNAVIEFCRRARVWTVVCDPADVIANQGIYDIDLPAGTALVQIASVRIAGKELIDPATIDNLDRTRRGEWDTETGTTRFYTQIDDETFMCTPVPMYEQLDGLLVRLIVKPSRTSTGFPNWINERYQDGLVAGAKARLMMMQGQPWYNPGQAAAYFTEFDNTVGTGAEDAAGSLVRGVTRVTPHH